MKKTLLLGSIFFFVTQLATAQSYQFSSSTAAYTELAAPTVISTQGWDQENFLVPIPFNFQLYGNTINQIVTEDGTLLSSHGVIWPLFADLIDNGTSVISYKTEGAAPNRILKVQWKNAGFYDGLQTDFANFQLWLYEDNNNVEMRYGARTVNSSAFAPNPGPFVGIFHSNGIDGTILDGSPANPVAKNYSSGMYNLSSAPANGMVYTFTYELGTGIRSSLSSNLKAGPNPFSSELAIEIKDAAGTTSIKLYDLQGKLLLDESVISQSELTLNTENVPTGMYMLVMSNGKEVLTKKLVKN